MEVIEITNDDFNKKIDVKGKVLVDCYASWCGPCKMLSPIIDEVASEIDDVRFYKLDVDLAEAVASKYQIMSIPTLLLFEDGELKKTSIGFIGKDDIINFIK
jgi:thioredoxin 1